MTYTPAADVRQILDTLGIVGTESRHEVVARCPNAAAHSGGEDAHPSWRVVVDPGHPRYGSHYCHPCGFGGGMRSLVRHVLGVGPDEAAEILGESTPGDGVVVRWNAPHTSGTTRVHLGGMTLTGVVPLDDPSVPSWVRTFYRVKTGTSIRVAADFGVVYGVAGRLSRRIVFPAETGGRVLGYSARAVDFRGVLRESVRGPWPAADIDDWGDERAQWIAAISTVPETPLLRDARRWFEHADRRPGIRYLTPRESVGRNGEPPEDGADLGSALFYWDRIWPPDDFAVTLVEGAIKAIRLAAAGWPNPVGIPGASGLTPARAALLASASRIWYPGDPDAAGRMLGERLVAEVAGRFTEVRPVVLRAPVDRIPVVDLARIMERVTA